MKTLFLLCFLITGSVAVADDGGNLLQNGDFSSGLSEWEGDCHTAGSALDNSGATTGVVVALRSSEWTQMTQDFDGKAGTYLLTISYTVSPDFSLSTRPEDYERIPSHLGFSRLTNFNDKPGNFYVFVNDLGVLRYNYWRLPPVNASGVQTLHLIVRLKSDDEDKKGFYLGFPPGAGSINIQGISLAPTGAAAGAN